MSEPTISTRRWSRAEYERLTALGVLHEDEPIELLDGHLVVREPQGSPHATAIRLADHALRRAFGEGWDVRSQLPIALDDDSEPEPDIAVVPGSPRDYRNAHPSRPVLVVEVAESRLDVDRVVKGRLYARAAVPEYWIVNLVERRLEVYREPGGLPTDPMRAGYKFVAVLQAADTVAPLAVPAARITVADLLP